MRIRKNGNVVRLTESDLQRIVKRVLSEKDEKNLTWSEFKELMKFPFKEAKIGGKNLLRQGPNTMLKEFSCKYKFIRIYEDGSLTITPYKQNCFEKWKNDIINFFKKHGYNMETYEYETKGYPDGATKLTTIKKNGLKTKIEFNEKTKDVLNEFVKDNY